MPNLHDQYENLPGVKVEYKNNNLHTAAEVIQGENDSVLIIGTAIDGPVGEPVSVNVLGGPREAQKLFGGTTRRKRVETSRGFETVRHPHGGTLIRAMYEMIDQGADDIRLLRVDGRSAKTEIPAEDPNANVFQRLADNRGNNEMPGNTAFTKSVSVPANHRLVSVNKIEEVDGNNEVVKEFTGSTGYSFMDTTQGFEEIEFAANMYRPKNTLRVSFQASQRTYVEVDRSDSDGVLTRDPSMTNYFSSEHSNWSDDPLHTVNLYVDGTSIPGTNQNGELLYRVGREDPSVTNELTQLPFTETELSQGGIRFTAAYDQAVADGLYPEINSSSSVVADYYYYNDVTTVVEEEYTVPGTQKEAVLNFMPNDASEMTIFYETDSGDRVELSQETAENPDGEFTLQFPSSPSQPVRVYIKAGAAPVGVELFAEYETDQAGSEDAKVIVESIYGASSYGALTDPYDTESLEGISIEVEVDPQAQEESHKIIRIHKTSDKMMNSGDTMLEYKTRELSEIRTLRQLANYINNDNMNNVVRLDIPNDAGQIPAKGITPTNGKVYLGQEYKEDSGIFDLKVDALYPEGDNRRYPWTGHDGLFDRSNPSDMNRLYHILGGEFSENGEMISEGVYSRVENYTADIIYMAEAYANTAIGEQLESGETLLDGNKTFAQQLAQHCAVVTAKTHETIGVISMAPVQNSSLSEVQEYINLVIGRTSVSDAQETRLVRQGINPYYKNVHLMKNVMTDEEIYDDEGNQIDIGGYLSVVFGPEAGYTNTQLGNYTSAGGSVYAALISSLDPSVSTTNRDLAINGMRYRLSEAQHNDLVGSNFVTFDQKTNTDGTSRYVVKDGTTAARNGTDYERLSTVRIVHATVQEIRRVCDPFLGSPNGIAQRNSMATAIQARLDGLKERRVLNNFRFTLFSSNQEQVLGNVFIQLQLVPAFEIRKINTSVSLRSTL